jgi:hypothetical protein
MNIEEYKFEGYANSAQVITDVNIYIDIDGCIGELFLTKNDVIAMAKAMGVTADDLKGGKR